MRSTARKLPLSDHAQLSDDGRVKDRLVVATEALADRSVTRRDLTRRYVKLHRNVYARAGVELSARDRARAAWLWSGRTATLVGHSAAAQLGCTWIPADAPVELAHSRRPASKGITVRSGELADDEVCRTDGIACTTAARTAYDLGRWLPLDTADRYPGARAIRRLRVALDLADAGAESPQETRLRLLLVRARLPRPATQIPVANQWGRVVSTVTTSTVSSSSPPRVG